MSVYPSYGLETLPTVCQYGQDVTYTNWGVTGNELEPKARHSVMFEFGGLFQQCVRCRQFVPFCLSSLASKGPFLSLHRDRVVR